GSTSRSEAPSGAPASPRATGSGFRSPRRAASGRSRAHPPPPGSAPARACSRGCRTGSRAPSRPSYLRREVHWKGSMIGVKTATLGTSRTRALAIEKEGADLVLCGRKALDSETWQVPCQVAAFLGWPHVTSAAAVERSGDSLRLTRHTDLGEEVYEVELPVVVS